MSHITNLQAYQSLIGYCTGYGGKYNPGRQNLRLEALQAQLEAVRQSLEQVKETKVHFISEVNERKKIFAQLSVIAANVLRTMVETGSTEEQIASARMLIKGILGYQKARVPTTTTGEKPAEQPSKHSSLQMSYWAKSDAFSQLIMLVSAVSTYQPSVPELSLNGLTTKLAEFEAINQRVVAARVQWSNALAHRTSVMYTDHDSLWKTARSVKNYLRIMLGHESEQFEQVSRISVTKLR